MPDFKYPKVHLHDKVEFARTEDTPDYNWVAAEVTRTKNNSIDVKLLTDGRPKVDVRHVGDPTLIKVPTRDDSGVFRLATSHVTQTIPPQEHARKGGNQRIKEALEPALP